MILVSACEDKGVKKGSHHLHLEIWFFLLWAVQYKANLGNFKMAPPS